MTKSERNNLILSIISVLALGIALLLNYYRTEWFGVIKGYAPHNFGFNLIYFIPLLFVHYATAGISLFWLLLRWDSRFNIKIKWVTVLLIIPAILSFILGVIQTISLMRMNR
jgi:hypothetical protein